MNLLISKSNSPLRRIVCLVLLLSLFSATPALAFRGYVTSYTSKYKKVLRRCTERGEQYSMKTWDLYFKWYATLISDEYLKAFYYLWDYYYPNGQNSLAEKFRTQLTDGDGLKFFIAHYAADRSLKPISGVYSLWDLALQVNGETIRPLEIKEVNITFFQLRFFPQIDDRRFKAFVVKFPKLPAAIEKNKLELQLASVGGVSTLTFKENQCRL